MASVSDFISYIIASHWFSSSILGIAVSPLYFEVVAVSPAAAAPLCLEGLTTGCVEIELSLITLILYT